MKFSLNGNSILYTLVQNACLQIVHIFVSKFGSFLTFDLNLNDKSMA